MREINERLVISSIRQHEISETAFKSAETASVGVSLFPFNGRDPEALIRNADAALYKSKEKQRGGYWLYEEAADGPAPKHYSKAVDN